MICPSCSWPIEISDRFAVLASGIAIVPNAFDFGHPRLFPQWFAAADRFKPAFLDEKIPSTTELLSLYVFPGTPFTRSKDSAIVGFRDELNRMGVIATIRRTRGEDIDAACGQLVGRVIDRTVVRLGSKVAAAQARAVGVNA